MRYNKKVQWMLLFALIMAGQVSLQVCAQEKATASGIQFIPKEFNDIKLGYDETEIEEAQKFTDAELDKGQCFCGCLNVNIMEYVDFPFLHLASTRCGYHSSDWNLIIRWLRL